MTIAITGASGFIGAQLAKRHTKMGDKVRVLSRFYYPNKTGVHCFCGDLTNTSIDLAGFLNDVDILYHCAGEIKNESLMIPLHVNGTERLVNAAKGKIGRWVQLSSVGVYGSYRDGIIVEESNRLPIGMYETTKAASDNIVKHSGIPYVILRPSNVFGKGMPNQSLKGLIKAIHKGVFFFIGKKDKSLVNYVHVSDVVNALVSCGTDDRAVGEDFNLSQLTTVDKMIASFASGMKSNKKVLRIPESFVRILVGVVGWIPRFPLTTSRVDALTSKCVYNSTKIQKLLNFKYGMTLEKRFLLFAQKK